MGTEFAEEQGTSVHGNPIYHQLHEEAIRALYTKPNVKIFDPTKVQFKNSFAFNEKFIQGKSIGSGSYAKVFQASFQKSFSEKLKQFE